MAAVKKTYYEILGLGMFASPEEIKANFRELARKTHPDVNKEPDAEERFKEINEAFSILSDQEKRATYDRKLAEEQAQTYQQDAATTSPQNVLYQQLLAIKQRIQMLLKENEDQCASIQTDQARWLHQHWKVAGIAIVALCLLTLIPLDQWILGKKAGNIFPISTIVGLFGLLVVIFATPRFVNLKFSSPGVLLTTAFSVHAIKDLGEGLLIVTVVALFVPSLLGRFLPFLLLGAYVQYHLRKAIQTVYAEKIARTHAYYTCQVNELAAAYHGLQEQLQSKHPPG